MLRLISVVTLALAVAASAQDNKGQLPMGEGKDVVERVCAPCHGVYRLTQGNRTQAAWQRTVDNMESLGAKGTDADFKTVVEYLTKNFGVAVVDTININKAGARSLTNYFKLFPEEADAIIAYREKNGNFASWEDLKKVSGLDVAKIEAKKDEILF